MVLEGSTSEDGFGNDASSPPSDNDIYNSQTETISYESLTETLPRSPFGSEAELQRVILARLKEHEQIVKRPLTKPEVEFSVSIIAFWASLTLLNCSVTVISLCEILRYSFIRTTGRYMLWIMEVLRHTFNL